MRVKKIWIITMFPAYFDAFMDVGVIGQLLSGKRGHKVELSTILLSEYSDKGFKGVDSPPYGGGPGVVMRADILKNALMKGVIESGEYGPNFKDKLHIIYTSPRGILWNNQQSKKFAKQFLIENNEIEKDLVFICGRYEGIDERFISSYIDQIFSLGDFVLSGGELAVMSLLDSAFRFSKGALRNEESANQDSFEDLLVEHPQYTRPAEFEGISVPEVLRSGHHQKIMEYQLNQKVSMTKLCRPDLYDKYQQTKREK